VFLPLVGGVILGLLILPRQDQAKKSRAFLSPQQENIPIQISKQRNAGQSLETYLLSSQSLLAKAIEISKNNIPEETTPGVSEVKEGSPGVGLDSPGVTDSGPGETTPGVSEDLTPGVEDTGSVSDQITKNNKKIIELINQAIGVINEAISFYPTDPRGWAQRARIYQTVKAYLPGAETVAVSDWQKAIQLAPSNIDYCQSLVKLYLDQNDLKSAVFYLKQAAEANPTDPNLLKKLAEYQIKAGMLKQAKLSYQQIIAILIDQEQRKAIQKEIGNLDKLLAQVDSQSFKASSSGDESRPEEIALPESPPLLEAKLLAKNRPIIAIGQEIAEISQSEQLGTNAYSGAAVIPAGEKEIKICNENLSLKTQVYLSAKDSFKGQVLIVKRKAPYDPKTKDCAHFVAAIKEPLKTDLEFNWWIIN